MTQSVRIPAVLLALLVAFGGLTMASCSSSDSAPDARNSEVGGESSSDSPGTTSSSGLSNSKACSRFLDITSDLTLTDEQSANEYANLASSTADPELAGAIQDVADGFARHDEAISSASVMSLC